MIGVLCTIDASASLSHTVRNGDSITTRDPTIVLRTTDGLTPREEELFLIPDMVHAHTLKYLNQLSRREAEIPVDRWWKFGEKWPGCEKFANLLSVRAESGEGAVINVDFDRGNL